MQDRGVGAMLFAGEDNSKPHNEKCKRTQQRTTRRKPELLFGEGKKLRPPVNQRRRTASKPEQNQRVNYRSHIHLLTAVADDTSALPLAQCINYADSFCMAIATYFI
jgi:hypothetical protein